MCVYKSAHSAKGRLIESDRRDCGSLYRRGLYQAGPTSLRIWTKDEACTEGKKIIAATHRPNKHSCFQKIKKHRKREENLQIIYPLIVQFLSPLLFSIRIRPRSRTCTQALHNIFSPPCFGEPIPTRKKKSTKVGRHPDHNHLTVCITPRSTSVDRISTT